MRGTENEGGLRDDNGQIDSPGSLAVRFPTHDPSYTTIGGCPQFGFQGRYPIPGDLGAGRLAHRPAACRSKV